MPLAERVKVVGLDPGRATVIVAGALILETIVALAGLGLHAWSASTTSSMAYSWTPTMTCGKTDCGRRQETGA